MTAKPEHDQRIVDSEALVRIARLLRRFIPLATVVSLIVGVWIDPSASAQSSGNFLAAVGHWLRNAYGAFGLGFTIAIASNVLAALFVRRARSKNDQ